MLRSTPCITVLLAYESNLPVEETIHNYYQSGNTTGSSAISLLGVPQTGATGHSQPTCFLCDRQFKERSALTRHCKSAHFKNDKVDLPFSCPQCRRCGMPEFWIAGGALAWSGHVERVHGKQHAPNLRTDAMHSGKISTSIVSWL